MSSETDVDPWAVDRFPVRSSVGRRLGLDAVSAGQRYTIVIAAVLAVLVSVFSHGPTAEGDDFLDGIGEVAEVAPVAGGPSTFAAPVAVEAPVPAPMPPAAQGPAPPPPPAEAPPPSAGPPSSPTTTSPTTTPPPEESSPLPVELPLG